METEMEIDESSGNFLDPPGSVVSRDSLLRYGIITNQLHLMALCRHAARNFRL